MNLLVVTIFAPFFMIVGVERATEHLLKGQTSVVVSDYSEIHFQPPKKALEAFELPGFHDGLNSHTT